MHISGRYIKSQRLSWFGHINRMPESSFVKKIYKWHSFTNRPVGRPKSRWEGDIKNDLKKLKVVKCSDLVQDRHKWTEIVEKPRLFQSCSADEEEGRKYIVNIVYLVHVSAAHLTIPREVRYRGWIYRGTQ